MARHWQAFLSLLGLAASAAALGQAADAQRQPAPGNLDFTSCAKPQYPQAELAAGHEGRVTMAFQIDTGGKVTQSRVTQSSGYPALDETARLAIAQCRFGPVKTKEGKTVPAWTAIQYVWTKE